MHDERGQIVGPRSHLHEALESATGAQDDPLSIIISTQAPNDGDLLSMLIDDAKTGADPLTKLFLWQAPDTVNPFSEDALRAANPGYDAGFINHDERQRMAADARRLPSAEASYRNLNLNQRVQQTSPFIAETVWHACTGPVNDDAFAKGPVYMGSDLKRAQRLNGARGDRA